MKKITYDKDYTAGTCKIYADGELIETIPAIGCTARLKELGFDFAVASAKLTKSSSGSYGWGATRSSGIRRGV